MAFRGILSYLEIAYLLQMTGSGKKSGKLTVTWEDREARLYFDRGKLVRAESNRAHEGIGSLLVRAGLLTAEQLDSALQRQGAEGGARRLGSMLCEAFALRPDDVERVLRRQFESIVLDVFGWPGGTFEFQFSEAASVADRFCLEPSDFILGVGIRAGLLAEEGLALERPSGELPPIALIEPNADFRARCLARWRLEGYRASAFARLEEAIALLGGAAAETSPGVVLLDAGGPPYAEADLLALGAVETAFPGCPVVAFGHLGLAERARLVEAGASAFVTQPSAADLEGPHGDFHFDRFLREIRRAVVASLGQDARLGAWAVR